MMMCSEDNGGANLTRDVIGVIATFLPQTTEQQRTLMLVSNTWFRGVIEQDGMKPKPGVFWPWCALQERQPSSVVFWPVEKQRDYWHATDSYPSSPERTNVAFTDEDFSQLVHGLPHLTSLNVFDCDSLLHTGFMAHLLKMKSCLTSLDLLRCNGVSPWQMARLEQLSKNLRVLCVGRKHRQSTSSCASEHCRGGTVVSLFTQGVVPQSCLQSLTCLDISYTETTDATMALVAQMEQLVTLRMSNCPHVTESGLRHIGKLKRLNTLDLNSSLKTPETAAEIMKNNCGLTSLDLSECAIAEGVLEHIGMYLGRLRTLSFFHCFDADINDVGIAHIANGCPHLTSLNLTECTQVSNAGLLVISEKLTKLQDLQLYGLSNITDAGFAKIENLTEVKVLNAFSCRLSSQRGEELEFTIPGFYWVDFS